MHKLEPAIELIEQQLHSAVENDDDHALFIASYLHGHFDLVVSRVLSDAQAELSQLDAQMRESLAAAFADNELISNDAQQVLQLWGHLVDSAGQ